MNELSLHDFMKMVFVLPVENKNGSVIELILCAYEQDFELSPVCEKNAKIILGEL